MKKTKTILVVILCGIAGFFVGRAIYNSFLTDKDVTTSILEVLEENCNCKEISKSMYAKGIQFNKNNGFTTEKVEFSLKDCNYQNFEVESNRISKLLTDKVKDFTNFNLVVLEFESDTSNDILTIKNGIVQ